MDRSKNKRREEGRKKREKRGKRLGNDWVC
jgi:hypothetical protein